MKQEFSYLVGGMDIEVNQRIFVSTLECNEERVDVRFTTDWRDAIRFKDRIEAGAALQLCGTIDEGCIVEVMVTFNEL